MGPVWPPPWSYSTYGRPQHLPSLPSAPTLPSGCPGTCPAHRPRPSLAPGCHQHMSTLMFGHTKKYTPPTLHAHTNTQTHGCVSTHRDACTHRLYMQTETHMQAHPTQAHSLTHPPKTHTPAATSRPHTDRSHTLPWFRALSPRGLWKPGHHLLFPLLQVRQSGRWRGWGRGWGRPRGSH